MNKLLYLLLIAVCWSCSQDSETEKHQSKRDQVVDVRDKMKEFSTQDVLIGRISRTYLIDNYLIVTDYNSPDKLIHLFDKNTFEHLASSTYQGQGPDEITIIGHVGKAGVSQMGEKEHPCIQNLGAQSLQNRQKHQFNVHKALSFSFRCVQDTRSLCI